MKNKPLIGITCGIDYEKGFSYLKQGYYRALQKCGAMVVLVADDEVGYESELIDKLDGLLLSGGPDVDPMYFGEESYDFNGEISPERDKYEIALAKLAFVSRKPVLGICRGMQVLNIAMGGTIYQDIKSQIVDKSILKHVQQAPRWYPSHEIAIDRESRLYECFMSEKSRVNSFHHQAVKAVAMGFKSTARASDGVIEAIEYMGSQFAVGIQWHPEAMWEKDSLYLKIFNNFVEECKKNPTTER